MVLGVILSPGSAPAGGAVARGMTSGDALFLLDTVGTDNGL